MVLLRKIAWRLLAPSTLIIVSIVLGAFVRAILQSAGAEAGAIAAADAMVWTGAVLLAVTAFIPLGPWLLRDLERAYAPLDGAGFAEHGKAPDIIVLGGAMRTATVDRRMEETITDSIQRMLYAAKLARQLPEAQLYLSGGQVFMLQGARSEADMMSALLTDLGVSPARLHPESQSRNTQQNAHALAALLGTVDASAAQSAPRYLLVTSAFHMKRAMGEFLRAGMNVIAAPTDWRSDDNDRLGALSPLRNLGMLDLVVREYLGLAVLALRGRR